MSFVRHRGICSLNHDILIDILFPYLSVRDILRLRMVCKFFYRVTHNPSLWKRILRELSLPIPPLPQILRYKYERISSFETEKLVCRALSVDANWKSKRPRLWLGWKIPLFADTLSIKMLPGGHYMAASIKRGNGTYALQLLQLDHRVKTAYPVASFLTGVAKPYAIQAKYVEYRGRQQIMISYVRREPRHQRDRDAGIDVSDFSDDSCFEYPVSVRYELVVLHCELETLGAVSDPRYPPGTEEYSRTISEQPTVFGVATVVRSKNPFEFMDLDLLVDWDSSGSASTARVSPCIAWVQGDRVYFKNLTTKAVSSFTCGAIPGDPSEYRIRAIRMLPPQGEVLVVRTGKKVALQLFTIPASATSILEAQPRQERLHGQEGGPERERTYTDVQISYHSLPLPGDTSIAATIYPFPEPTPLYIYALSEDPWSATLFRLWPQRIRRNLVRTFSSSIDVDAFAAELEDEMMNMDDTSSTDSDTESVFVRDAGPRARYLLEDTTFRYHVVPHLESWITPNAFTHNFNAEPATPGGPRSPAPNQRLRILPGCSHALLYGTDVSDRSLAPRLSNIHTFADMHPPVPKGPRWPDDVRRAEVAEREHDWLKDVLPLRPEQNAVASLLEGCDDVQRTFMHGLVAIAWDDWAGRVCMIPKLSPSTLYLLDYAFVPREDENGHRVPVPVPDVDWAFRPMPTFSIESVTKS